MRNRLLVLMYHRILRCADDFASCAAGERRYAVTAATLDEHLACVGRAGVVRCLVTFDDSYETHYSQAFPVLAARGVEATFFVTVGEIGRGERLSWGQLREMSQGGMSIESHGWSHRFMTMVDGGGLSDELARSRERLEDELGRPVRALSLPGGRYDTRVLEAARLAGYERVFCSDVGINRGESLPFPAKRLAVRRDMGTKFIERALVCPARGLWTEALRWRALSLARGVLGERIYAKVTGRPAV